MLPFDSYALPVDPWPPERSGWQRFWQVTGWLGVLTGVGFAALGAYVGVLTSAGSAECTHECWGWGIGFAITGVALMIGAAGVLLGWLCIVASRPVRGVAQYDPRHD